MGVGKERRGDKGLVYDAIHGMESTQNNCIYTYIEPNTHPHTRPTTPEQSSRTVRDSLQTEPVGKEQSERSTQIAEHGAAADARPQQAVRAVREKRGFRK